MQGSPQVVYNIWSLIELPPFSLVVVTVVIANLCGLYNCIAYTVIRRRLQQQKATRGPQVVLSHGDKAAKQASNGPAVGE